MADQTFSVFASVSLCKTLTC